MDSKGKARPQARLSFHGPLVPISDQAAVVKDGKNADETGASSRLASVTPA